MSFLDMFSALVGDPGDDNLSRFNQDNPLFSPASFNEPASVGNTGLLWLNTPSMAPGLAAFNTPALAPTTPSGTLDLSREQVKPQSPLLFKGDVSGVDTKGSAAHRPMIDQIAGQVAAQFGLDPRELADSYQALVEIESHGDPNAQSAAGALGLGQVMPFHFQSGENPFDPQTNLRRGMEVYADNVKRYRRYDTGAAAYFGAIDQNGNVTNAQDVNGQTGSGYVNQWQQAYTAIRQQNAARQQAVQAQGQQPVAPNNGAAPAPAPGAGVQPGQARNLVPDQYQIADAGDSGCGPAAIAAWGAATGKPLDVGTVLQTVQGMNVWDVQHGMYGPDNTAKAMQALGLNAQNMPNASAADVLAQVQAGRPVIVSTEGHYFFLHPGGVNAQGQFYVGQSGLATRLHKDWLTLDEMAQTGPINGLIFVAG